jgi:hypothetical protein
VGAKPTPQTQPAAPPPGGVDAVEDELFEAPPLVPDLSRVGNERAKDEIPDEVTEPDRNDTSAAAGEEPTA